MGYELLTRTGRSFYEVTSAMQNAIRKGDYEIAGYAMYELLPGFTPYLCKRLLVISAEDCYGIITKEILSLTQIGTEETLTKALSLMCLSKKNRDADYVCCNLMYNDTVGETDKMALAQSLCTAIMKKDIIKSCHLADELFHKNRKLLWETLEQMSKAYYPHLTDEISALHISNELMKSPDSESVFAAKAMVLMWTERDPIEGVLGYPDFKFTGLMPENEVPIIKPLEECRPVNGLFPEWAYNWHTTYGKYKLRRDAVHAVENDQRLLTPLEVNLFDDCTWDRDYNACLKSWNPRNIPLPYHDGKRDPAEKFRI